MIFFTTYLNPIQNRIMQKDMLMARFSIVQRKTLFFSNAISPPPVAPLSIPITANVRGVNFPGHYGIILKSLSVIEI